MKRTKQDVIDNICVILGIPTWRVSTGSTEPKGFLLAVSNSLGLSSMSNDSKPDLARRLVEASGEIWLPTYESEGATITRSGLEAIETSIRKFLEL
jgi:hypothetical protein